MAAHIHWLVLFVSFRHFHQSAMDFFYQQKKTPKNLIQAMSANPQKRMCFHFDSIGDDTKRNNATKRERESKLQ